MKQRITSTIVVREALANWRRSEGMLLCKIYIVNIIHDSNNKVQSHIKAKNMNKV
jgi:hypothetical protein